MGSQIRLAVGCIAGLLLGGCAQQGWKRPSAPPLASEQNNPCADLTQVRHVAPRYPRAAAGGDQEGWVALKYAVAANGAVFSVQVIASSPEGVFDKASTVALARSRYLPMNYPVRNCSQLDVYSLSNLQASR